MTTDFALLNPDTGEVINCIVIYPYKPDEWPNAVPLQDDLPVTIGDFYDKTTEKFYRNGKEILPYREESLRYSQQAGTDTDLYLIKAQQKATDLDLQLIAANNNSTGTDTPTV